MERRREDGEAKMMIPEMRAGEEGARGEVEVDAERN